MTTKERCAGSVSPGNLSGPWQFYWNLEWTFIKCNWWSQVYNIKSAIDSSPFYSRLNLNVF
uniref:Uncharacterized protein n=1 Tax=Aster yellows phytoplasma TaxID=35779 RepID=Q847U1_ASTYP|nr:hypothetical protein [Aster yellows phytoplasma]